MHCQPCNAGHSLPPSPAGGLTMNPNPSSSAIVLGASIAGLATARALSQHFDHVTVIERDRLPDATDSRKGVPQGNHAHGLLASGYRILDSYFPGMMDE